MAPVLKRHSTMDLKSSVSPPTRTVRTTSNATKAMNRLSGK